MQVRSLLLIVSLALFAAMPTSAAPIDAAAVAPGAKVEYRASSWPEQWEQGTIVRMLPGDTQVLIREKPSQFYPEGFERAYSLDQVRGLSRAAAAAPTATAAPAQAPQPAMQTTRPGPEPGAIAAGGNGLLSEDDIIDYLQARLGDDPFGHPQREAIRRALGDEIKRRGVGFHYEAVSDFSNRLSKFGATTDLTTPIDVNYGPPGTRAALFGRWSMDIIGATTTFVRDDTLYRRGETGAKGGVLEVRADGTYVWQTYETAEAGDHVAGRWRAATADEMGYQGGEGLVLQAAKSTWDWIVLKERKAPEGDWIRVSELTSRQVTEYGARIGQ